MAYITTILKNLEIDLYRLIEPYKHTSISTMDADIENQLEKVSKKCVVASGNVFINILIFAIDSVMYLNYIFLSEFDMLINNKNTFDNQYVNVNEKDVNTNEDYDEIQDNDKIQDNDEIIDNDKIQDNDEIIDNDEKNYDKTHVDESYSYWFGIKFKNKLKDE